MTVIAWLLVRLAVPAAAQDLGAARSLYTAARYEEALTALAALRDQPQLSESERGVIEQYRSLCLIALGRDDEAADAIAALVRIDPFYQLDPNEISPSVRAQFRVVRQQVLPDIARAQYTHAKATYDRREFVAAAERFGTVVTLVDDPDMLGRLADLRTLAAGFQELSEAGAAAAAAAAAPDPEPPAPEVPRVYTSADGEVTPPVAIEQDFPAIPLDIRSLARSRGVLEVLIDEEGRVVQATVRQPIHPTYDRLMLVAATQWRYEPARLGDQRVKFRKLIEVRVK